MTTPTDSETARFVRYVFVLPEPVGLPDGYQHSAFVGDDVRNPQPDDPTVSVTFHQATATGGQTAAAFAAMASVLSGTGKLQAESAHSTAALTFKDLKSQFTVVEAVTAFASPDKIPSDVHDAALRTPRQDPFARCVELVNRVVTAFGQATETPVLPVAYPKLASPVLFFTAIGSIRRIATDDGDEIRFEHVGDDWDGPSVMLLDHANNPDVPRGPTLTAAADGTETRIRHWLTEQARGNPLSLWRERILQARAAREVTGDLASAVLLANTSAEVMLDSVLALLAWEEGADPSILSAVFQEGKLLRRLTQELPPRLRGNWSTTAAGPVADWYQSCYRLRHRIIHGGHAPTPTETQAAIASTYRLQRFLFDRIAERRTTYPRSTLMTVGQEGLIRRGMWTGQIRGFSEEVAPTESNWVDEYTTFYRALLDIMR